MADSQPLRLVLLHGYRENIGANVYLLRAEYIYCASASSMFGVPKLLSMARMVILDKKVKSLNWHFGYQGGGMH